MLHRKMARKHPRMYDTRATIFLVDVQTWILLTSKQEGEFLWDERLQSLVTGSFFWGYIVTQLTGGRLAERIGTKYMFASLQITVGIVTVCLPALAKVGVEFFIMGRIMLGLAQVGIIICFVFLTKRHNKFGLYITQFSGSFGSINATSDSQVGSSSRTQ